ncbi:MAG: PilZ domain-containing protein [Myxococcales bacterium]|nr:PilZ domain-containing protein [Myxococcota bacterium]MDW8283948.1 PilZ domain-containing protein [Myxococcales bacterium]
MRVLRARYRTGDEFLRHYQPAFAAGGLFFPTRTVLPVGEPVVVEVRFPELINKTMIRGQVAWHRSGQHRTKLRAGLGIEFHPSESRRRDFLLAMARGLHHPVVMRRHRRLPVTLPATWRRLQDRHTYRGTVEDIGPGGALLRPATEGGGWPPGTELVVGLSLPGSVMPIEMSARVVWSSQVPGDSAFGVEFRCRDAGGQRRLKEVVRRLEQMEGQARPLSDRDLDG